MSKIQTIKHLWKTNKRGILGACYDYAVRSGITNVLSDETFLKLTYWIHMGRKLDLKAPKTFNEKLQWLKLYDRNPKYIRLVDKYLVKQYVAEVLGEEYVIPTLGVWERAEDIQVEALPDQFVLKCTHDSGSVIICKDKRCFDLPAAKKKLGTAMKKNHFWWGREWPYKDVEPRIIAEAYMEDTKTGELRDYKFFCFRGEAKALFVATERQKKGEEVKFDFFDMDYHHLNLKQGHPNAAVCPAKPVLFDKMRDLAEKLSKDIPHVRVDFYEAEGKIYFGELTFSHFCGMVPFEPVEWDLVFGGWINHKK